MMKSKFRLGQWVWFWRKLYLGRVISISWREWPGDEHCVYDVGHILSDRATCQPLGSISNLSETDLVPAPASRARFLKNLKKNKDPHFWPQYGTVLYRTVS